jgi:hypothetical protein
MDMERISFPLHEKIAKHLSVWNTTSLLFQFACASPRVLLQTLRVVSGIHSLGDVEMIVIGWSRHQHKSVWNIYTQYNVAFD